MDLYFFRQKTVPESRRHSTQITRRGHPIRAVKISISYGNSTEKGIYTVYEGITVP